MHTRQSQQQTKDTSAVSQTHAATNQQSPEPLRRAAPPTALIQRVMASPGLLNQADVLQLHRTIGNRAVGRLVGGGRKIPPVSALRQQDEREKQNTTGLPDRLKAGIETLSGVSLDGVKVHYNSAKPAHLQALAYTQGTDIHVAPRQERHLPHEAWHVVQQQQGRVKPTTQMKDSASHINNDAGLEKEADERGAKALQMRHPDQNATSLAAQAAAGQRERELMEASTDPSTTSEPSGKKGRLNFLSRARQLVMLKRTASTRISSSGITIVQRKAEPEQQFPGREHRTVGVGEKILLSVSSVLANQHRGKLEWISDSSAHNMGQTDANGNAEFTAGDSTGPVTLICRTKYVHQTLDQAAFRIKAPTGGHMEQAPGTQIRHLADHWNVSFVGNQFLHPQGVSFHNIEFREEQAPAQYQPTKNDWLALTPDHKQGPWVDVEAATSAQKGSQVSGDDWVSSGQHQGFPRQNPADPIQWNQRPPGQPATMTWSIPWRWRLMGTSGSGKVFATVDHVAYDYGNGEARLTKGGVDVRANATDQPQWFYPNMQDNVDRIKYYYDPSRHTPGYGGGGQWQHIEGRLRKLPLFALADLVAMARENVWAPQDGLDASMTLDDLITREAQLWNVSGP